MKKGGAIGLAVVLALSLFVVLFVTTGVHWPRRAAKWPRFRRG